MTRSVDAHLSPFERKRMSCSTLWRAISAEEEAQRSQCHLLGGFHPSSLAGNLVGLPLIRVVRSLPKVLAEEQLGPKKFLQPIVAYSFEMVISAEEAA